MPASSATWGAAIFAIGLLTGAALASLGSARFANRQDRHQLSAAACRMAQRSSSVRGPPASIPFFVGRYEGAALQYGGHYSFYTNIDKIMSDYVAMYKAWHPAGTLLDVGGRNGELSALARGYGYAILERDMPSKAAQKRFKYYACDLYDCQAKLEPCLVEIIYCNNVLEHLLRPHDALISMAKLLKYGGLLLLKTQWLWRYHATKTYGDYFRYSARALEYLCIQSGLNPVFSGYQQMGRGGGASSSPKLVRGGMPGTNDVPRPLAARHAVPLVCHLLQAAAWRATRGLRGSVRQAHLPASSLPAGIRPAALGKVNHPCAQEGGRHDRAAQHRWRRPQQAAAQAAAHHLGAAYFATKAILSAL